MPCSAVQADQIKNPSAEGIQLLAEYNLPNEYTTVVNDWIDTFEEKKKTPTTISFKASDASKTDWSDLKFDESQISVTGSYALFFRASYTENNQTIVKEISAKEAGSDLSISLTCTGFKTFPITQGPKW